MLNENNLHFKSELIYKIYFLIFHIILFIPWLEKYHLKMDSTNQNLEVVYPYKILSEFVKKATKHYENGFQKQLMACVVGYRKNNKLIGKELLFPKQSCPHTSNTSLGKEYLGKYLLLQHFFAMTCICI